MCCQRMHILFDIINHPFGRKVAVLPLKDFIPDVAANFHGLTDINSSIRRCHDVVYKLMDWIVQPVQGRFVERWWSSSWRNE